MNIPSELRMQDYEVLHRLDLEKQIFLYRSSWDPYNQRSHRVAIKTIRYWEYRNESVQVKEYEESEATRPPYYLDGEQEKMRFEMTRTTTRNTLETVELLVSPWVTKLTLEMTLGSLEIFLGAQSYYVKLEYLEIHLQSSPKAEEKQAELVPCQVNIPNLKEIRIIYGDRKAALGTKDEQQLHIFLSRWFLITYRPLPKLERYIVEIQSSRLDIFHRRHHWNWLSNCLQGAEMWAKARYIIIRDTSTWEEEDKLEYSTWGVEGKIGVLFL